MLVEERHAQVLQDVEAQFHKKMMIEVGRYYKEILNQYSTIV